MMNAAIEAAATTLPGINTLIAMIWIPFFLVIALIPLSDYRFTKALINMIVDSIAMVWNGLKFWNKDAQVKIADLSLSVMRSHKEMNESYTATTAKAKEAAVWTINTIVSLAKATKAKAIDMMDRAFWACASGLASVCLFAIDCKDATINLYATIRTSIKSKVSDIKGSVSAKIAEIKAEIEWKQLMSWDVKPVAEKSELEQIKEEMAEIKVKMDKMIANNRMVLKLLENELKRNNKLTKELKAMTVVKTVTNDGAVKLEIVKALADLEWSKIVELAKANNVKLACKGRKRAAVEADLAEVISIDQLRAA